MDLAGLRVPSSRDAEDEAACRRDEVVVCRVCNRAYAKYTCPRCHTRYCALACYKAHDARCVESFHGDALGDAMRGLVVDDDEKKKMAALLRAYAPGKNENRPGIGIQSADGRSARALSSASSGDDEVSSVSSVSSSSERRGRRRVRRARDGRTRKKSARGRGDARDAARCALSSANLRKLNRGEALTLADLSPETMRVRARGAHGRAEPPGRAARAVVDARARDIKLRRDGTSVVAPVVVDEPESRRRGDGLAASPSFSPPEALSSDAPPPPIEDTPLVPLHALLAPGAKRAGPSPALRWHALDVLAAYTLATRAHDGDWRADPLAAARATSWRSRRRSRRPPTRPRARPARRERSWTAPPRVSRRKKRRRPRREPPDLRGGGAGRRGGGGGGGGRDARGVAAAAAAAAAAGSRTGTSATCFGGGGAPWS